ncbi:MAG: response regulator [Desulfamplus sp.]|nr:response regulator [Desulfamplus sp.]
MVKLYIDRSRFNMRIRDKTVLLVIFILLLFSVMGIYSVNTSSEALTKSYAKGMIQMAQVMQYEIVNMISQRVEQLQTLVTRDTVVGHLRESNLNLSETLLSESEPSIHEKDLMWRKAVALLWEENPPVSPPGSAVKNSLNDLWSINNEMFWDAFSTLSRDNGGGDADRIIPFMMEKYQNDTALLLKDVFISFYERLKGRTVFSKIFLTDRHGVVTAMSHIIDDYYYGDKAWWQEAMENRICISEVHYDRTVNGYGLAVAIRLDSPENGPIGVVRAILSSNWIMREVNALTRTQHYTDIKVTTGSGRLIYSNKPFIFFDDVSGKSFFRSAVSPMGYSIVIEGGVDKLYASVPVISANSLEIHGTPMEQSAIHELGGEPRFIREGMRHPGEALFEDVEWLLFIGNRVEDVLDPMYLLRKQMIIVYCIMMLLSLLAALFFARRMARAVTAVRDAAVAVKEGELTRRIDVKKFSRDELGELAESFNVMTSRLENSYDSLEKEIAVRKEAERAAEAASRAKSTFLANMSHELRTPLNAVIGFSQLLERDDNASPDQREKLGIILNSGMHLLVLINDILEMSKIEAGRVELEPGIFDPREMVQDVMAMMEGRTLGRGVAMESEIDPDLPRFLEADQRKIRQVLINLMGNAVKFTEQGKVILRVSSLSPGGYQGAEETHELMVEVEDTGIGIAPEDMDGLFRQFSQVRDASKINEGSGLGLSISNEFVRIMGGTMRVESEPGRGSLFSFTIPVKSVGERDVLGVEGVNGGVMKVVSIAPGQKSFRILVVEDNEESRNLLTQLLLSVGFQVRAAANGLEGVELFHSFHPHLIWMDIRMPVMDGHGATRRIRQSEAGKGVVIIALTASAFEEEKSLILSSGCDDFISKPFLASEIFGAISRYLGVKYIHASQGETAGAPLVKKEYGLGDAAWSGRSDETLKELPEHEFSERVMALPENSRESLRQAILDIDLDIIDDIIHEIKEKDSVIGSELTRMVRDFKYGEIMDILVAR